MKIAALIPLILEMNTSIDFLNLIQNVEEYNFDEFLGELYFAMQKNLDQYDNTVGLEFDLRDGEKTGDHCSCSDNY